MVDNNTQRTYHAADDAGGNSPASGNDPLAELARLIGQNNPFGEYGHQAGKSARAAPVAPAVVEPTAEWTPHAGPVPGYPAQQDPYAARHQAYHEPYQAQSYAAADLYHSEDPASAHQQHPEDAAAVHPQHQAAGYEAYADPDADSPHDEAESYDSAYADPNMAAYAAEEGEYFGEARPRRRVGVLAIAVVFALAVVGTAGAFGYRAVFGRAHFGPPPIIKADTKPSKIVPTKKDAMAKLIQDRAPAGDKLVSREEKPVDLQDKPAAVFTPAQDQSNVSDGSLPQQPALGSGVIGPQPHKVHTVVIRPDQLNNTIEPAQTQTASAPLAAPPATTQPPVAAPVHQVASVPPAEPNIHEAVMHKREGHKPAPRHTVARVAPVRHRRVAEAVPPANAPLSLNPYAPSPAQAEPARSTPQTVSIPRQLEPKAGSAVGSYAVQLSARRSEADAKAAFRSLRAKYPSQLSGRHPLIRRVDLGQKGIYYRTMVGPFGSSLAASRLCSQLKAAGGSCFVQRI